MRTGSVLKGKAVAPTQGRTRNHPDVSTQKLRGLAEAPTQGRTRNHPSVAPIPKNKPGNPVPNSYFANSRTAVHPKFDTKRKHD